MEKRPLITNQYIPIQTLINQIEQFGQKSYKKIGLLNKHFCIKNPNILNEPEKFVDFLFSHYKSMGTISCHSDKSFYPIGVKKIQLFVPLPIDAMSEI